MDATYLLATLAMKEKGDKEQRGGDRGKRGGRKDEAHLFNFTTMNIFPVDVLLHLGSALGRQDTDHSLVVFQDGAFGDTGRPFLTLHLHVRTRSSVKRNP